MSSQTPSAIDLAGFRAAQRLAFDCAQTIHAQLKPGMTEREVATMMKKWLADNGATDCLHEPFAWFGERTAFRGLIAVNALRGFNPAFFPSGKKLEVGMPFILDCAPTLNGYTADIGYSGALGENPVADQLMDDLAAHRQMILAQIKERRLMSEVSQSVDALCVKQGVEPRHHAYPFAVLAHRVEKLPEQPIAPKFSVGRFGIRGVLSLGRDVVSGFRENWSPVWSSHQRSAHPPVPGLWAVEPHLGFRGVGAKFEELLVITEDDAFWLDDDVPHVQRWIARGVIGAPTRRKVAAGKATAKKSADSKTKTAATAKQVDSAKVASPKKAEPAKKAPAKAATNNKSDKKVVVKKPAASKTSTKAAPKPKSKTSGTAKPASPKKPAAKKTTPAKPKKTVK